MYDRVTKWGGAERVLLALHSIWPEAPLYTVVYDKAKAPWARVFDVRPSWLQHVPFAMAHHEWFAWATPLAFESFNFDAYDVVISVTSAEAKNIITKPETLHICYCLTPTRYLWSGYETYAAGSRPLQILAPILRRWDRIAGSRPDYYLAISNRVKERIKKYYGREVEQVIYPPVDIEKFSIFNFQFSKKKDNDYFLVVSRLVQYKRIDIIVEAFNALGWKLVIIGDGTERQKLQRMAQPNIQFITRHLTDAELVGYYQSCRALVVAADEDFGIAAVEAQAAGVPVIAFRASGIAEIVRHGSTGILYDMQTSGALASALEKFAEMRISSQTCRDNAERFSQVKFINHIKETVEMLYKKNTI